MTKLIKSLEELNKELEVCPKPLGLVPTMGALHEGHMSLAKKAKNENETVIVYVFVNPLQFGPKEDFNIYPRTLDEDFTKCKELSIDYVFAPTIDDIYPNISDMANDMVDVPSELKSILCGKTRQGHFNGVATVIKRFFEIIKPNNVYFGQKDMQQVYVIRWLIKHFNFDLNLVECPIIRENNGLALSSRNKYLNHKQIELSSNLYRALKMAKENVKTGIFTPKKAILESLIYLSEFKDIKVEYFEARDKKDLGEISDKKQKDFYFLLAAKLGNVRLIDNIEV